MNFHFTLLTLICNIYLNVYNLLCILIVVFPYNSCAIVSYNHNNLNFLNNITTLGFTNANCKIKGNIKLWANKLSRYSPEMDLIRSSVNNPDSRLGRLIKPINVPNFYIYRQMEEMLKRGISMNDIKELFFEPIINESEFGEIENIYIPPFRKYVTPTGEVVSENFKLIGRDYPLYKDGKFNLEKSKFSSDDVFCQTLLSSILEYDKLTEFQSKYTMVPTLDLDKYIEEYKNKCGDDPTPRQRRYIEVLESLYNDSFVLADNNLPVFFNAWNREYLKGLEKLREAGTPPEQIDKFTQSYLNKIDSFNSKLMKNYKIYSQITDDFKHSKLFTHTIDFYGNKSDKWTEYLNNDLLEFLHKYSMSESQPGLNKLSENDVNLDYLDAYIKLTKTNYIMKQKYKEEDKLFNEYLDFNFNRRKKLKYSSPRPIPYWIWNEFWRNRDQFVYENYHQILKEIAISNPFEDLSKLTKGTVQNFYSTYIPESITKRSVTRILNTILERLEQAENDNILKTIKLINRYTHNKTKDNVDDYTEFRSDILKGDEIDLNAVIDKIVELKESNARKGENKQLINLIDVSNNQYASSVREYPSQNSHKDDSINDNHDRIRELINREGAELEIKPVGFDFKDVLSFDKFEEEYKKFNLKHFGTEDYNLYKGQLVKGKVYRVSRSTVSVDIHAHALATLPLNRYYDSPTDVPLNGFLSVFKPGDELMFEVDEIWDNSIVLSLLKIKNYHKYRNIIRHKKNNEIFYVKVLQRYTKGILVEYVSDPSLYDDYGVLKQPEQESTTDQPQESEQSSTNEEQEDVDYDDPDLFDKYIRESKRRKQISGEIAFIPLRQLSKKYKDAITVVKMNLVGKILPVMYYSYDIPNQIPILSTKTALRRMQMINMRKGDIVKGIVKEYERDHVVIKFGSITGILHLRDMNDENYKQHMIDYPKSILTQVKYVDPATETILLTTRNIFDVDDRNLLNANRFLKTFKQHPSSYHVDRYNAYVNNDTDSKQDMEDIESMIKTVSSTKRYLEEIEPHRPSMVEWKLVGDKLLDDPSLMHGYNIQTWYIKTNQWVPFPSEVQDSLNYQFNNNNEVAYFDYLGDSYKVLFDKKVALTFKRGIEYVFPIKSVKLIES